MILEPLQISASQELHSDSLMHLPSKTTDKTYSTFTRRAILVTFNNQNLKQKAFELTFSVSENRERMNC